MRPSEGRLQLWPAAVAAMIVVVALLSFDLPFRLNHNPPQQYRVVQFAPGGTASAELADEYWDLAVRVVQWKYPYGTALPQDPVPEFTLVAKTSGGNRAATAARQQYWNLLRQLWPRPEVWHRRLEFDVSWAGRAVRSGRDFLSALFGH